MIRRLLGRHGSARLLLVAMLLTTGCGTTLSLTSTPPGASVRIDEFNVQGARTNSKIDISNGIFSGSSKATSAGNPARFSLDGYREVRQSARIVKNQDNYLSATLDKLDTTLELRSEPSGVRVLLNLKEHDPKDVGKPLAAGTLPEGWQKAFTTPATLVCTSKEASLLAGKLMIVRLDKEGYQVKPNLETGQFMTFPDPVTLKPGQTTRITFEVESIVTTLKVVTVPEGCSVEDMTKGGFGYLGETPLTRRFTYEDVKRWARSRPTMVRDAENVKSSVGVAGSVGTAGGVAGFEALRMTIRVSKPGYADRYLSNVSLPISRETSFKVDMEKKISKIAFASDPQGAHVYLNFTEMVQQFDEKTGKVVDVPVKRIKHLGTTPCDYAIDPEKPLAANDTFTFKKSGYVDATIDYSPSEVNYHLVLDPKVIKPR